MITLDTTRADRLGCYGYAAAETPALDALAARGVRFEQAFCQVPLTLPSHASLLTGLYPPSTGLRSNTATVLPADLPVLATAFQGRGYRTGAFIGASVLRSIFGLSRGFDHYDEDFGDDGTPTGPQERAADKVADAALAWLNAAPERPFFAWVHFFDAHFPYAPPPEYVQRLPHRYDGEIAFMDTQFQRLLDWVATHERRGRTLVIAVGDHGEAFGEHDEVLHGHFIYDATVRVPLIFAWPGRLPEGKLVAGGVPLVDVMPTILDLLDWPVPPSVQGATLRPAFQAEQFAFRPVYTETEYPLAAFGWAPLRSYTNEQWRYIEAPRPELYDRTADPGETSNVSAQHPDVLAQLQGALEEALAGMPEHAADSVVLDDQTMRALASLGYVGVDAKLPELRPGLRDPKDMVRVFVNAMGAQQLMQAGRFEEALPIAQSLVEQSPESDELYNILGYACLTMRRFAQAAEAYRNGLRLTPTNSYRLCQLGEALEGLGRDDEAIDCYQKALAASADYPLARRKLGLLYVKRKDFAKAESEFRRCAEVTPESATAQGNLGFVWFKMGRFDDAVRRLRQALTIDPRLEMGHRLLWQALFALQRRAEGVDALRNACQHLPNDMESKRTLAGVLATMPQRVPEATREAIQLAQLCCQREPVRPENHDVLGLALAAAGDLPGAINATRQALALAQQQNRVDLIRVITPRLQAYEARRVQ